MRNPQELKWWSVIQAVEYYGWGVGRSALDAFSSLGLVCHSRTRDRVLKVLRQNLVETQMTALEEETAVTVVLDNYGETLSLKQHRSGRSAKRLSGTHEKAHQMRPFTDTRFDDHKVSLSYSLDQSYPSPLGIADYENDLVSFAQTLLLHKRRQPSS